MQRPIFGSLSLSVPAFMLACICKRLQQTPATDLHNSTATRYVHYSLQNPTLGEFVQSAYSSGAAAAVVMSRRAPSWRRHRRRRRRWWRLARNWIFECTMCAWFGGWFWEGGALARSFRICYMPYSARLRTRSICDTATPPRPSSAACKRMRYAMHPLACNVWQNSHIAAHTTKPCKMARRPCWHTTQRRACLDCIFMYDAVASPFVSSFGLLVFLFSFCVFECVLDSVYVVRRARGSCRSRFCTHAGGVVESACRIAPITGLSSANNGLTHIKRRDENC